MWKMFGEGKYENFRTLLMDKLSPHMSSHAFQFWMSRGPPIFEGQGLFHSGGSHHALKLAQRALFLTGTSAEGKKLAEARTLKEQEEIWDRSVCRILLSRWLHSIVVGSKKRPGRTLLVPKQQHAMIKADLVSQSDPESLSEGYAIWKYAVNTLDPVVHSTLFSEDNPYYLLLLQGKYSPSSHPDYLKLSSHVTLSHANAFDGLRIHTDEVDEVIAQMVPGTLTIAVLSDSMDLFDPEAIEAETQIRALNKVLAPSGRVLLKSVGLWPWYISKFEELGFQPKCHGSRAPGTCIDR